jgi:hypothetical protein
MLKHVSAAHLENELERSYSERAASIDNEVESAINDGELDGGVDAVVALDADADFAEDVGRWLADVYGRSQFPQAEAVDRDTTISKILGNISTNGFGPWS